MKYHSVYFWIVGVAVLVFVTLVSETQQLVQSIENWSSIPFTNQQQQGKGNLISSTKSKSNEIDSSLNATVFDSASIVNSTTQQQQQQQQHETNLETNNNGQSNEASSLVDVYVMIHTWAEMGNWLFFSIMGKCLQLKLQDDYGIESRLILKLPNKWSKGMLHAKNALQRCFPFYQKLSEITKDVESGVFTSTNSSVIVEEYHILPKASSRTIEQTLQKVQQAVARSTKRTIVKLHITSFLVPNVLLDRYFDTLREYFVMNQTECCISSHDVPEHTIPEHVYHYRNFELEMSQVGQDSTVLGMQELSPRQAAVDLFGYLNSNSSNNDTVDTNFADTSPPPVITVITRFKSAGSMAQVRALQDEGFVARFRTPYPEPQAQDRQTNVASTMSFQFDPAMQDFCYLIQARGDIAGMARSTFYQFASLFGRSRRSWLIVVDSPEARSRLGDEWCTYHYDYNWTHPVLTRRIQYRLFLPEQHNNNNNSISRKSDTGEEGETQHSLK